MIQDCTFKSGLLSTALLFAAGVGQVFADNTILWQEGFETYNTEPGQTWGLLDKNGTGPNAAPDGSGNPWFGNPSPVNAWLTQAMENPVPAVETVTPHSGNYMIRGGQDGAGGWYNLWDNDLAYVNIAYRFNGGKAFKTSFAMDWWFYDAIGDEGTSPNDGPGNFGDWAAIEYRPDAPTDSDYGSTGGELGSSEYMGKGPDAALAIGAYEYLAGYNVHVYQVRVKGASDTGTFGNGWFNTSVTRSHGWHHASIVANRCGLATFSIDGTVVLTHDTQTTAPNGFNVFTVYMMQNTPDTYNQSAYYDDITLAADLNAPIFADADEDGDVDLDDYGVFQACWTGLDSGYDVAKCGCFDRGTPDGKIDTTDLAAFNACYSGPMIPVNPSCGG